MEQFGKYTLIKAIGAGGMAEVYLARTSVAQGLNKTLVIKKIRGAYARSRQFVTMFIDEAKIALDLNHPNIIQVFDFGAVGDTYFLAMEHVDGIDLLRMLQAAAKARVRLPYGLSAYIVQQVVKGLDYAHRKTDEFGQPLGIVHRDVSPQNVLLSWDGGVKLVDFGIARARDVDEEAGVIKGKFAYMSPEQARGEPVDNRSDVFAAGIVLYELACARPLFHGKGKQALDMVKSGAIPRPKDFAPELPDSLERIVLRALAFNRDDRYQTARDMQHDLGRFQLEWGQKTGEPIDSGALAAQLAVLVAPDDRLVPPRPPAADDTARERRRDSSQPIPDMISEHFAIPDSSASARHTGVQDLRGPGRSATPRPEKLRDAYERKYVYVLEGIVRGVAAAEHRLGAAATAQLLTEFHKIARDVVFKHHGLLDMPRLATDSGHVDAVHNATAGGGAVQFETGSGTLRSEPPLLRAVIGLPVASEDDASRAIRLALALIDTLDGIGSDVEPELRLALGVKRGIARVRPRGTSSRDLERPLAFDIEEGTAAFAHKLAQKAQSAEILVGGRTFRAARHEWRFEPLPVIDLPDDGMTGIVSSFDDEDTDPGIARARVYRLRGRKQRSERLAERRSLAPGSRLHDRDLELKALRDAWRDVQVSKRKRQLLLVGDPGVGKRTLVRLFLESIAPGDATVVRTIARVGTAMTPYGVIADLARDVLGLAEDAEPHEVERRLLRAAASIYRGEENGPESLLALHIFGMLLGARAVAPNVDASIDADTRRQVLLKALGRLMSGLEGDKPVIVISEDVHWIDRDSQELFAALLKMESSRPLLGIMTARPEPRVLAMAKDLGTEVVILDELTEGARRELLASRFVPNHDIDALVEQIAARAGGNAFFILELVDALIDRGILVPDDGEHPGLLRWVKRDAPIHVPSTIEDLIIARIDGLPADQRETMIHAAILGRHVAAARLSSLLGRPVRLDLDELVRRGLLSPLEGEYRFKNDMTMTVAHSLIPREVQIEMHRSVAARIAGAPGYRVGQDDALIARHLELAGDAGPAAERYLYAASHAIELGGNADAFRQLARALKLLPTTDHERRFAAFRLREEILRRLGKRTEQLRELHAMRKEAEAIGEAGKLAMAHCALAQFYVDVGKAAAALRAIAPALQYAREANDPLAEAEALRLRAAIARMVGNTDEALRMVDQALHLVEAKGAMTEAGRPSAAVLTARATILNQRGTTLWNIGKLEQSIESYAEALVIYRAIGMQRQEAKALNNMGIVFAALGEYEEALSHYKSALKIDQALGERSGIALKLGNIGQCYSDLGDYNRAESYLSRALKVAEKTGDLLAASDAAVSWGQTKLQRGDARAALRLFERGLALATESRERYQEVRALAYTALAHIVVGTPAETALEMARSATEWARKMPMRAGVVYGLAFQALALSKLGRHDEAIRASDNAIALLEEGRTDGVEHVWSWRAAVMEAAGKTDEAQTARNRAQAEIAAKADKLRDPDLRKTYLESRRTDNPGLAGVIEVQIGRKSDTLPP